MITDQFADKISQNILESQSGNSDALPAESINQRALIIVWGAFIVFVLSVGKYNLAGVIAFAAFPFFLILIKRLSVKFILKRLALLSPFVLLIAAANPFFDTRPFMIVDDFTVSRGVISGLVIAVKSIVAIAAVITLTLCIPFNRLCDALRGFRIPDVFITQLILIYRYSFLLVEEALMIQKARQMRSFGKKGKDLFTTAKLIGSLLLRTVSRAERIYKGMVSRGFNGTFHHTRDKDFKGRDILFIGTALLLFFFIRIIF